MLISLTDKIKDFAKSIINENHNILNLKIYLKHRIKDINFESQLKQLINTDKVDYVLFSSRSGAAEHVDTHLKHLDIFTYIIPIILPGENVILRSEGKETILELGVPVRINHQLPHSLIVSCDQPLVLVMASKVL